MSRTDKSTMVVVSLDSRIAERLQKIAKQDHMTPEEAAERLLTYSVNEFPLVEPRISPEVGIEL